MNDDEDLEREELARQAEEELLELRRQGVTALAFFKFTCEHCGTRCTLADPNTLHLFGECFNCGKETEIKRGGYSLLIIRRGVRQ